MPSKLIRVPKSYYHVFEEAKKRRRKYLSKGYDVSLFRLMMDIEKEEEDNPIKVFRL